MAWVVIGVAVAQMTFQVVWAFLKQPGKRIARLEGAVFGETGVHMKLQRYVTTEVFDKRMSAIDDHMKGISEEGQRREDRILAAINNQTLVIGSEMSEIKTDLRAQAQRIDTVILERRGDRR